MTFPFSHDGIPIAYYGKHLFLPTKAISHLFIGQEQGYQGGTDPYNREA